MKFKFAVDIKSTVFERCHYSVEANTKKEAEKIMLKIIETEDYDNDHLHKSEVIEDSLVNIDLVDNNDEPTAMLYDAEGRFITDNIEL